jgi:hypothetical protein
MENSEQKPISDLERIQESYTSGTQAYDPGKDKAAPTPAMGQEAQTLTHSMFAFIAGVM